jgi:hypothetical protein
MISNRKKNIMKTLNGHKKTEIEKLTTQQQHFKVRSFVRTSIGLQYSNRSFKQKKHIHTYLYTYF